MIIHIYDWRISPYALCMVLALSLGLGCGYYLLIRSKIEARIAGLSCFMNVVFILLCGKLYTIIFSYADGMRLINAPFSSVGGLIGMLVGIETYNCIYKADKNVFRCVYVVVTPLIYGISKIGCFLMGCCHGIQYEGAFAVSYVADIKNESGLVAQTILSYIPRTKVFPNQLCEVVIFLAIFLYGIYRFNHNRKETLIYEIIIAGGLAKTLSEFLRFDYVNINANQSICLLLVAFAFYKMIRIRINGK